MADLDKPLIGNVPTDPRADPAAGLRSQSLEDDELKRTIHELRVHQIELETQANELREAKTHIEESRAKYAELYDSAPVGYVTLDANGCIREINLTGARMLKIRPLTIVGQPFLSFVEKSETRAFLAFFHKCRTSSDPVETELTLVDRAGHSFIVEVVAGWQAKTVGNPAYHLVLTDITERKRLEEQRLMLSKLEGLGVLAGGIAHDFNNLLTVILGNAVLARHETDAAQVAEKLNRIEMAAEHAQRLARQLLTFAKGGDPVRRTASLRPLVEQVASLVFSGSPVAYSILIPETVWAVHVDEGQIGQGFQNIFLNVRDAGAGTVTVQAENVRCGVSDARGLDPGLYVRVTVTDTGRGMSPEVLAKVFDPYFTTKEAGHGLGLAVLRSVVQKHGGTVTAESTPGKGTTFAVYLPAVPTDDTVPAAIEPVAPQTRRMRILLMDDEPVIRQLMGEMLKNLGHDVALAGHGDEAVRLYLDAKATGNPFDLVILDLTVVGGLGGRETLEKLRTLDENVRAIAFSGYSDSPIMAHFHEYGFQGRLAKPFAIVDLEKVLASFQ